MPCYRLAIAVVLVALTGPALLSAPASSRAAQARDPYEAALAYVGCMRDHGIPLPDPKADGDIELTRTQEARMPHDMKRRDAADRACFHFLRGTVKTKPLSPQARARLADLFLGVARCMRKRGFELGDPVIQNMPRGQVRFLFPHISSAVRRAEKNHDPRLDEAQRVCERGLSARIDAAIGQER